jgi:flagellar biosynthesis protein FliR
MMDELRRLGIEIDISLMLRIGSLILARFIAAGLAIPFFGGQLIPGRLKFGIPLVFTVFLYPFIAPTVDPRAIPDIGIYYVFLMMKELFVGYCLGFIVALPFYAVETAGSFMDTQRGTTFAQVVAPLLGGQTSLLAQFYLLLFISIFVTIGGMHLVIEGIGQSYHVLPIIDYPSLHSSAPFVNDVIKHTGDILLVGLTLSAPVVIAMLLTDITLGVVNRTAPSVQVFWIGMPIKTLGGLVVVFFVIGFAADIFADMTIQVAVSLKQAAYHLAAGSG